MLENESFRCKTPSPRLPNNLWMLLQSMQSKWCVICISMWHVACYFFQKNLLFTPKNKKKKDQQAQTCGLPHVHEHLGRSFLIFFIFFSIWSFTIESFHLFIFSWFLVGQHNLFWFDICKFIAISNKHPNIYLVLSFASVYFSYHIVK
jgi:hypothetical protein